MVNPFTKDEFNVVGEYQTFFKSASAQTPKFATPITSKENFDLLFSGKQPVWAPSMGESMGIIPRLIVDNVARGFTFDADTLAAGEEGGPDMFGIEWVYVPEVGGSMVRPGAPRVPDAAEWEKYITFPDPDSWDWAGSAERNRPYFTDDRPVKITILNGLFERLISFMDFENAATAMIDEEEQEGVHRLFDKLAELYINIMNKAVKYYGIGMFCLHDDWGSQRSPFFSLATCREMLVPYLKRIVDAAHELGLIFELHSCGKNEMLVPAMIEAGVDTWAGQPMNDKKMLIEKYGDKMIFGVAPLSPLEGASDEEVLQVAADFMRDYYNGGRVIVSMPMSAGNDVRFRNAIYELSRKEYDRTHS